MTFQDEKVDLTNGWYVTELCDTLWVPMEEEFAETDLGLLRGSSSPVDALFEGET